jgi:MFS family permease
VTDAPVYVDSEATPAPPPPARASGVARVALYAGGFIGPFGGGMVTVLLPELADAFSVSTSAASLAVTGYFVPYAAIQLVSGTIGERIGRAHLTRVAFVVYGVASLGAAAAGSLAPFLVARAVQGSANAFTSPLVLAGLADTTPREQLGRTMGTFAAVQTAGMVCAPLIGGLAGAIDYRLAFLAAALVAFLLAVPRIPARRGGRGPVPRLRSALTERTGWLAAAAFLAFFGVTGFGVVLALYAGDAFGLGPEARGLLLAGFGVAGVVVGRPAGGLVDRLGDLRVIVTGSLACAVLLPLAVAVPDVALLAGVWILAGVGSQLLWAGLNTLLVSGRSTNRGGVVSIVGSFKFAGSALAPVAWLPLYETEQWLAFAGAAVAAALVSVAAWRAALA